MTDKKTRVNELTKVNPLGAIDHRNLVDKTGNNIIANLPRRERRKLASQGRRLSEKYKKVLIQLASARPETNNILN